VDVRTPGKRAGTEVVQMYVRDCVSRDPPGQGVEGLPENFIAAGRDPDRRARHHARVAGILRHPHEVRCGAGEFEIMVGNSSCDGDLQK